MNNEMGKILIILGAVLIVVGVLFIAGSKFNLGKLPGDINIKKDNFSFHFPVMSSIIISIIISAIMYFFRK
jgi:uncharacterized membrane protein YidH (DUF202 family)